MKIRDRLHFSSIGLTFLVGVLFILLYLSHRAMRIELTHSELANRLVKETTHLIMLTNDLKLSANERNIQQWQFVYNRIIKIINDNNYSFQKIKLENDLKLLKKYYSEYQAELKLRKKIIKRNNFNDNLKKTINLENVLKRQMHILSQEIIKKAFAISLKANKSVLSIQQNRSYLTLSFTLFFFVVVVINMYLTKKKISGPLLGLLSTVNKVTRNDFKNINEITFAKENKDTDDEIEELTIAYNNMIKNVTELVNKLRKEVAERKNAETRIKKSLHEKEILLKEIHHRVKNNMQIISSMLHLQSQYLFDERDLDVFIDSQNRVFSMSLVHELLYNSDNFSHIDYQELLHILVAGIQNNYCTGIITNIKAEGIFFEMEIAMPLTLIINELVSNSFKHAFGKDGSGIIDIELYKDNDGKHTLIVKDNGVGVAEGFDPESTNTLGFKLVFALVSQVDGNLEWTGNNGMKYTITFTC